MVSDASMADSLREPVAGDIRVRDCTHRYDHNFNSILKNIKN